MIGFQAAGSAPIYYGKVIDKPETVATAIRIGNPARGEEALSAAEESRGRIIAVSDEEILAMQRRLASEGVWVEPASAAGVAGLAHELQTGRLDLRGKRVVAVCTGHGMKDPEIIAKSMPHRVCFPAMSTRSQRRSSGESMKLKIGVPATTANLGPGFDCLALTLDLWNEAEIEPAADFRVEVSGEGSTGLPTDENNLVIRATCAALNPRD